MSERSERKAGTILDRFKVDGQVAVITGAGRGIGAAAALALAEAGADVVISARHSSQLAEVADQVRSTGRRALVVKADLSDLEQTAGLAQAAYDEFGRLDILVNNVGGTMPLPFLDTDEDFLVDAFKFNVATAHALTRAAVPLMLTGENPGGSIVNISSVIGRVSGRGYVAYGTAKAALSHWTRLVSKDLAPLIRVNAIGTGSIMTSALEYVADDEAVMTELAEKTTMQRVGQVEDIAAAVVYLASQAGSFLTGKIVEVDGGLDIPNLDFKLPDLEAR